MEQVVDYALEWDINPTRPDSWRIVITTVHHPVPFRLQVNSPEEFLAAAHMLTRPGVLYNMSTGMLTVPKRPAGT